MTESIETVDRCPDCGVAPGEFHREGCDVEQCAQCGRQRLSCGCERSGTARLPWTGEWPGAVACRIFGWYARLDPKIGWIPCAPEDPEAVEDLNRLYAEAVWDPKTARFVRRA